MKSDAYPGHDVLVRNDPPTQRGHTMNNVVHAKNATDPRMGVPIDARAPVRATAKRDPPVRPRCLSLAGRLPQMSGLRMQPMCGA